MVTADELDAALKVDDFVLSNSGVLEAQPLQLVEASHRSEDPVSRMTLKGRGGVPTLIVPR
jgi:hypothetical protein